MRKSMSRSVKFEPPPIPLSSQEFLVPLMHPSRSQMRSLRQALKGGAVCHIKSVGRVARSATGNYLLFAKLRPAKEIGEI